MSLVSELADGRSELTRWCARTFGGTRDVAREVQVALEGVRAIGPGRTVPVEHWRAIGGAFGQRLADLVEWAPPYYALLGLVRSGWVSAEWAHEQAAEYASHAVVTGELRARALDFRPVAAGWLDLQLGLRGGRPRSDNIGRVWADQLRYVREYLEAYVPLGTIGVRGVELELGRGALLLTMCEGIYRTGVVPPALKAWAAGGGGRSRAGLRELVDEHQAAELANLAANLQATGAVAELRSLAGGALGRPLGIAGPTIVNSWAEADLVLGEIDPDYERTAAPAVGTMLVDVKTVMSVRDDERLERWLWQVLCYVLLDHYLNLYEVRRVGLLFARHGVLVAWSVDELVERMTEGRGGRAELAQSLRLVAGRAVKASGGGR